MILARERFADESLGANLDLADFFEYLARDHVKGAACLSP
jgi:hypothetical protein